MSNFFYHCVNSSELFKSRGPPGTDENGVFRFWLQNPHVEVVLVAPILLSLFPVSRASVIIEERGICGAESGYDIETTILCGSCHVVIASGTVLQKRDLKSQGSQGRIMRHIFA